MLQCSNLTVLHYLSHVTCFSIYSQFVTNFCGWRQNMKCKRHANLVLIGMAACDLQEFRTWILHSMFTWRFETFSPSFALKLFVWRPCAQWNLTSLIHNQLLAAMVLFWEVQWQRFLVDEGDFPFDGLCVLCRSFVQMDVFVKNDPQIAGKHSNNSATDYCFRKLRGFANCLETWLENSDDSNGFSNL